MGKTKSDLMWQTPRVLEVDEPYDQYRKRMARSSDPKNSGKVNPSNLTMQVKMQKNWANPNTMDSLPPRSEEGAERQATGPRKGRKMPTNLREQVDKKTCEIYRKNWRTPAACEGEGGVKTLLSIQGDKAPKIKLRDHVNHEISETSKKKLNPDWVEQLQGLPVGWTQLSGVIDPNENRVDRLRLLGNGVVPQTAEKAFRTLLGRILRYEQ